MSVNIYNADADSLTRVAGNATTPIDDTTASTTSVYSSSKVEELNFFNVTSPTYYDSLDDMPYGTYRITWDKSDNPSDNNAYVFCYVRNDNIKCQMLIDDGSKTFVRNKVNGTWADWKQLATTDDNEFGIKSITEITQAIPSRQMGFMVSYGNNITGRPTNSSAWGMVRAYRYGATIIMYYEETSDNCETYKALYNSDGTVKKDWTKIY